MTSENTVIGDPEELDLGALSDDFCTFSGAQNIVFRKDEKSRKLNQGRYRVWLVERNLKHNAGVDLSGLSLK